jgi:hypothetical protein
LRRRIQAATKPWRLADRRRNHCGYEIVGKNKTNNEASLVPEDCGSKPAPHPEACLLSIPG